MTELEMEILLYIGSSNNPISFFRVVRRFSHNGEDLPAAMKNLSNSGLITTAIEQGCEQFGLTSKGSLLIGSKK
jgi:predicted transcriptional regulator